MPTAFTPRLSLGRIAHGRLPRPGCAALMVRASDVLSTPGETYAKQAVGYEPNAS